MGLLVLRRSILPEELLTWRPGSDRNGGQAVWRGLSTPGPHAEAVPLRCHIGAAVDAQDDHQCHALIYEWSSNTSIFAFVGT